MINALRWQRATGRQPESWKIRTASSYAINRGGTEYTTLRTSIVLVGNPPFVVAIMGVLGYRRRTGFVAGLTVVQISEFSLILAALGLRHGQIGEPEALDGAQPCSKGVLYSPSANADWPAPAVARSPSNPQHILRPQDLVVLLRLALDPGPAPTHAALSAELGMPASEAHAAVERAVAAKLAVKDGAGKTAVVRAALRAFVRHGARYCFPAVHFPLHKAESAAAFPPPMPPSPSMSRSGRAATLHRCGRGRRELPAASPSTRSIPVFPRLQSVPVNRPWP